MFGTPSQYPIPAHVHTAMKSLSTVDRFLVSPGLMQYAGDAGALHLGDNPSRHSPIMLKIQVEAIPVRETSPANPAPRRPAWYKADDTQLNTYTARLDEQLQNLTMPAELSCNDPHCTIAEHRQARDSFLLDVLIAMIETSYETIPMGGGKRKKWDPGKNCYIETALPGWREQVEPLCQDSMFWNSIWVSLGCSNSGEVQSCSR